MNEIRVYCHKCLDWKAQSAFSNKELRKTGKNPFCISCLDEANAQRRKPTPTPHSANVVGQVYFIQMSSGEGPIKIGFASNLDSRFRTIQAQSPVVLTLLVSVEGTLQLEYELHQRFAKDRLHYEWFSPTTELLALIDNLKTVEKTA